MTSLLLITNEPREGTEYGLRDEFVRLRERGVLTGYEALAPLALTRSGVAWRDVVGAVQEAAARMKPDVVMVLTPKADRVDRGRCPIGNRYRWPSSHRVLGG